MPSAIGAYSVGVKVNHGGYSTLYAAGQIGLNPETGNLISDNVDEQVRQAMRNVRALLASQGASFKNVVRSTLYLVDMNDFTTVDKAYKEFFDINFPFPARTAVAVH